VLSGTDKQALVYLAAVDGIGPVTQRKLIDWAGENRVTMHSIVQKPAQCPLISQKHKILDRIFQHKQQHSVESYWEWLAQEQIGILLSEDVEYPTLLKQVSDHPLVVYFRGEKALLQSKTPIAVIGTRRATAYGRRATQTIVSDLVRLGATIVSGFMYGIDTIAHQSAINNRGHTIGVLGYGFGTPIFPSSHAQLFDYLLSEKALFITQFAPKVPALPAHFPMRNAVVAGMTLATIVVEAAEKSGTMITVSAALEEGRLVCAVPGPFDSEFSQGTKHLLNQGALLVTSAEDILVELGYLKTIRDANSSKKMLSKTSKLTSIQNVIVEALRSGTCQSDSLAEITKLPIVELTYELTDLEIQGIIERSIEGWSLK